MHPYKLISIPSNAPFKLQPSPGKGWGVFATQQIPQGSIILIEYPLFTIPKPQENISEIDIWHAFCSLPPEQKQPFLCLRNNGKDIFETMGQAFAGNSFGPCSDRGLAGPGLFILHSRFNHSCAPNARIPRTNLEGGIASIATRDIDAGEEITISYEAGFEFRVRGERHERLRFACTCDACGPAGSSSSSQVASDMRRRLVRGLNYLIFGVDVNGQMQSSSISAAPLIMDRALKKSAENLAIPMSSRLIYLLFAVVLLEREGLLDKFALAGIEPGLDFVCIHFRLDGNSRIASIAMMKKTWSERLSVALGLWAC
ncbi:hypothetical protein BJX99DRAFT_265070 [Aspergillus californicus]